MQVRILPVVFMRFDWVSFCERYGISYVERGPNVARNRINIACPFCGDDPSHHLGLDKESGRWACWRNGAHRSKRPERLVARLLNVSITKAREITGSELARPDSIDGMRERLENLGVHKAARSTVVEYPEEFRLVTAKGRGARYLQYLHGRGITPASKVSRYYDLQFAGSGEWAYRLIFPLALPDGTLVGWTGRAIGSAEIRYKTYPPGGEVGTLFNIERCQGGRVLIISEGPVDALNLDWYGKDYNVNSTALLTTSATDRQLSIIYKVAQLYDKVVVLLDAGANQQAHRLYGQLRPIDAKLGRLPTGIKDPGELTNKAVVKLCKALL